ncbi:MAG: D-glycero-beta-D-manno-heptose-7-phosphate kinase [candidate division FCPU426 bacterium]
MDPASLKARLPRFAGRRVVVVGDVMADHYVWGKVSRISPEAPIPVVHVSEETYRLGGAANVAANLAALGASVVLVGVVGKDAMGQRVASMLEGKGIDPSFLVEDPSRPTIQKTRVIAQQQQVVRVDREKQAWLDTKVREALLEKALAACKGAEAILFSDYAKGVLTLPVVSGIIQLGRSQKSVLSVDPKPANIGIFRGASIITPNQGEAQAASGIHFDNEAQVEAGGRKLLADLQCQAVLITRGEHGMSLFEKDGPSTHIPTQAREVFDVTGAGDTVIATLTLALAAGAGYPEAAYLANAAAGIVVGEIGVAAVTPAELAAVLA